MSVEQKTEGVVKHKTSRREQSRVVINSKANSALEGICRQVNSGFDAGFATKSDVANYVFLHLNELLTETHIAAIRAQQFDEKRVLNALLKKAAEGGPLPESLTRALREHCGVSEKEKRKFSKAIPKSSPEFTIPETSAAPANS